MQLAFCEYMHVDAHFYAHITVQIESDERVLVLSNGMLQKCGTMVCLVYLHTTIAFSPTIAISSDADFCHLILNIW